MVSRKQMRQMRPSGRKCSMRLGDTFCCVSSSRGVAAGGEVGEAEGQISEGLFCHPREFYLNHVLGHGGVAWKILIRGIQI